MLELKGLALNIASSNASRWGFDDRNDLAVVLYVAFLSLRGQCAGKLLKGDEVHPEDVDYIESAFCQDPRIVVPLDFTAEPSIMTDLVAPL